jgi:hypothetical protein
MLTGLIEFRIDLFAVLRQFDNRKRRPDIGFGHNGGGATPPLFHTNILLVEMEYSRAQRKVKTVRLVGSKMPRVQRQARSDFE